MREPSHPSAGTRRYRLAGEPTGFPVRTEQVQILMDDAIRLAATLYVPPFTIGFLTATTAAQTTIAATASPQSTVTGSVAAQDAETGGSA